MTETFTHDRASFRERIARLVGGTTWREPLEGHSTDPHRMTDQDVAAALAFARQDPDDIGPDIAYCIVTGSDWHRARIILAVANALLSSGGRWLRHGRPHLLTIADNAFRALVFGDRVACPTDCPPKSYASLLLSACCAMDSAADAAIRSAERAFRCNGSQKGLDTFRNRN